MTRRRIVFATRRTPAVLFAVPAAAFAVSILVAIFASGRFVGSIVIVIIDIATPIIIRVSLSAPAFPRFIVSAVSIAFGGIPLVVIISLIIIIVISAGPAVSIPIPFAILAIASPATTAASTAATGTGTPPMISIASAG